MKLHEMVKVSGLNDQTRNYDPGTVMDYFRKHDPQLLLSLYGKGAQMDEVMMGMFLILCPMVFYGVPDDLEDVVVREDNPRKAATPEMIKKLLGKIEDGSMEAFVRKMGPDGWETIDSDEALLDSEDETEIPRAISDFLQELFEQGEQDGNAGGPF